MRDTTIGRGSKLELETPFFGRALLAFCGIVLVAAFALNVINGPKLRAAEEAAIDQENRIVCSKLGLGPESGRFSECNAALTDVRANDARRIAQSIL